MARQLDKIVVVDLESTCWEKGDPWQAFTEIIEIGVCTLDVKTLERADKLSYLVVPQYSRLSQFCTDLTGHTQEDLDYDGTSLDMAITSLRACYKLKNRMWASYGDYDRNQFRRECEKKSLSYPFCSTHLNVKNLFAIAMGLPKEVGMAEALEILELPLEGRHHNGADDAWNIAAILTHILREFRQRKRLVNVDIAHLNINQRFKFFTELRKRVRAGEDVWAVIKDLGIDVPELDGEA